MARRQVHFKAEDIWDTPEDGNRYEVIDGQLYVSPPPNRWHQRMIFRLVTLLGPVVVRDNLGEMYLAPIGVVLGEPDGVEPDIVFVRRERLDILSDRGIEGTPDLVVEVLSPSTRSRDRGLKMRRYHAAGVPHYWLVDYESPALETYRSGEQGYKSTGRYGPGGELRSDLFPGLLIHLDDIFA